MRALEQFRGEKRGGVSLTLLVYLKWASEGYQYIIIVKVYI
jgi:hypothetical protein